MKILKLLNKTYLSLQKQKDLKIIQQNDINSCIEELNNINLSIKDLLDEANNSENINDELLNKLQEINNLIAGKKKSSVT